jgi:hypothetical protein
MKKRRVDFLKPYPKSLGSYLKKNNVVLQNILNILMLIISIGAIVISIKSYNSANRQFEENSKKSDSLFQIQLTNEKMINTNLEKIQELTNNQINIINQQLNISTQTLNDQINSSSPKLIILETTLEGKTTLYNGMYAPVIYTTYKNVGKRYANDVEYRPFVITNDFKVIRSGNENFASKLVLGPDQTATSLFKPKFDSPITAFYYCVEISYLDRLTDKKNYITLFLKFVNDRGKDVFDVCSNQEKETLLSLLNDFLLNNHLKVFNK